MVFLVFPDFLEVLEMSSEVVGPGPNTREIKSLRVDPGPLACVQGLPAHDYSTTNHPPLVAPTSCPSTTRWMQLAVLAQSFAWLDETCASSARALLRGSDFYFHILRRRQHDHLPRASRSPCACRARVPTHPPAFFHGRGTGVLALRCRTSRSPCRVEFNTRSTTLVTHDAGGRYNILFYSASVQYTVATM